jgi:hypothetical protein
MSPPFPRRLGAGGELPLFRELRLVERDGSFFMEGRERSGL